MSRSRRHVAALAIALLLQGAAGAAPPTDAAGLRAGSRNNPTSTQQRPNLVFIMADDQGWHNGFNNPALITPHTDALLKEGLKLMHHFVYKFCSPTRSSLLSGRLPVHVNQENSATEQPLAGIPIEMTIWSVLLQKAGYKTAHIGKWHVGQASPRHIPIGRGFDQAISFFNFGEDHWTQIRGGQALSLAAAGQQRAPSAACPPAVDLWANHTPAFGVNGTYGGYTFTSEAVRVIEDHDPAAPLAMYIAFQNIHPPLQVPRNYIAMQHNKSLQTEVNGMITFLDDSVGNVSAALKGTGLWDQTLLVYSPDNGGYLGNGGDDTPLRGGKFSDFQGGVRVAAFAAGGLLPPAVRGGEVDGYIHICDWYVTFGKLAGLSDSDMVDHSAAAAGLPAHDSLDVWPLLSGQNKTSPRVEVPLSALPGAAMVAAPENGFRDPMYFTGGEGLIVGEWKLITGWQPSGPFGKGVTPTCNNASLAPTPTGWADGGAAGVDCDCGAGCLFHLPTDTLEQHDRAAAEPTIFQALQKRLDEIRETTYAPDRGALDPAACVANEKAGGYWAPWLK